MGWYLYGRGVPGKAFKFDRSTLLQRPHAYDHLLEADSSDERLLALLDDQHRKAQASQLEHEAKHMAALEAAMGAIIEDLGGGLPWDVEVQGRAAADNQPDDYVNGLITISLRQARNP